MKSNRWTDDPPIRKSSFQRKDFKPRNFNQSRMVQSIEENNIIMINGPAGCGKTFVASWLAAQALEDKKINQIIICRPVVQAAEEDLGYLPGTLKDKASPYLRPMLDAFKKFWSMQPGYVDQLLEEEIIEISPLAFMRGRDFSDCWVLCDEAQNMSFEMMKMLLTRLGENGKIIVTGDPDQRDKHSANGFEVAKKVLHGIPKLDFIEFGIEDVVRHRTVQDILKRLNTDEVKEEEETFDPPAFIK